MGIGRALFIVGVGLFVVSCDLLVPGLPSPNGPPPGQPTRFTWEQTPEEKAHEQADLKAKQEREARAVQAEADARAAHHEAVAATKDLVRRAITIVDEIGFGMEATREVIGRTSACTSDCDVNDKTDAARSKLGVLIGRADRIVKAAAMCRPTHDEECWAKNKQPLDGAKQEAEQAVEMAEKMKADLAARARQEIAEHEKVRATCDRSPRECKDRCKNGEHQACIVVADKMIGEQPPRFDEPQALYDAACRSGLLLGCMGVRLAAEKKKAFDDEAFSLWSAVAQAASEVVLTRYRAQYASTHFPPSRRNVRGIEKMHSYAAALVPERYCPAVNEYVAFAGRASFLKSAKATCDESPPIADSIGGEEVPLTAQCRAMYATACPPPPPKKKPKVDHDFVPECAPGAPWVFVGDRGCACGAEVRDPCASQGCIARPARNDVCMCDCTGR